MMSNYLEGWEPWKITAEDIEQIKHGNRNAINKFYMENYEIFQKRSRKYYFSSSKFIQCRWGSPDDILSQFYLDIPYLNFDSVKLFKITLKQSVLFIEHGGLCSCIGKTNYFYNNFINNKKEVPFSFLEKDNESNFDDYFFDEVSYNQIYLTDELDKEKEYITLQKKLFNFLKNEVGYKPYQLKAIYLYFYSNIKLEELYNFFGKKYVPHQSCVPSLLYKAKLKNYKLRDLFIERYPYSPYKDIVKSPRVERKRNRTEYKKLLWQNMKNDSIKYSEYLEKRRVYRENRKIKRQAEAI